MDMIAIAFTFLICDANYNQISVLDEKEINSLIFSSTYMNKQPLIIKSQIKDWFLNPSFFSIKSLYLNYGGDSFECGTSTDLSMMHNPKPDEITLKLYLRKSKYRHYQIFDPYFIATNVDIIGLKSLNIFHEIDIQPINAYTFLLGKAKSGISFQTHGNVWYHQITGTTKIFLYPPSFSPIGGSLDWTGYSSQQWNDYILPHLTEYIIDPLEGPHQKQIRDIDLKEIVYETNISSIQDLFDPEKQPLFVPYRPFEVILNKGDLLYIPRLWWYSTLNIKNDMNISIAMMMQTEDIPKEAGIERRYYNDALRSFKTGFEYLYHYDNPQSSKQYFEKTLLVDPTFISSYVALSDIYIQSVQQNKNKEHFKIVERFMKIAYMLNPDYDMVREGLAGLLTQKGDLDSAKKVENKEPLI